LIWSGPVQASDIKAVRWMSPVTVLVVSRGPDGGFGSSSFSLLADSLRDSQGRILPNLLAQHHLSASSFDRIAIAGFSAFHGLASPLLLADGDRIDAAVLNDACFSSYASLPKSGFVSFGARAARGQRLLVMSASAGGGGAYSRGFECADASFEKAVQEAGVLPEFYPPPPPVPVPKSGTSRRAGDFFYLNYNRDFSHGDHVHNLAVPLLDVFLAPYLAREIGAANSPATSGIRASHVAAGIGIATLLGGLAWAAKERSWPFS